MLVRCGTNDAEAEYASAVQWSSGGFLGAVDILSFFFFFLRLGGMGWE